MILISNLSLPLETDFDRLEPIAARVLHIKNTRINQVRLHRKSVDARKKDRVHFCCSLLVAIDGDDDDVVTRCKNKSASVYEEKEFIYPAKNIGEAPYPRPVVVGSGPAGLFAALTLARAGLAPILVERGPDVRTRKEAVDRFFRTGELDGEANVQFGEGGAGSFSDGKLTTGTKDPRARQVLQGFVDAGAPADILYEAKPHIGTDILTEVVKSLREQIISCGGEVWFRHKLTDIIEQDGAVKRVVLHSPDGERELSCDTLILAIGHSARDTFEMLHNKHKVTMSAKSFAVGARIEHPQHLIDKAQYGAYSGHKALPASDYKLSAHLPGGRGVYTFCMCPGGVVVASSSEAGGIVTNGMSYHARDGANASSALLVGVTPDDFGNNHPLAGMYFQRDIEQKAYKITGGYKAPAQRVEDFMGRRATKKFGAVLPSYLPGVVPSDLHGILPAFITDAMEEGIRQFNCKLAGFSLPDAVLTGPETRSSSPVRIIRDETLQSSIKGIYPCGEGAGYAGGIISAAVDGIRCAEAVITK